MTKTILSHPDGKMRDLPETCGTTVWNEKDKQCPANKDHRISGSSRRMYCAECGVYWNREE